MQVRKRALYVSMALSASWAMFVFAPVPVSAQIAAADETSAVHAYVARTWEISTSDYQIESRPDQGALHVYRVTVSPSVEGVAPAERVFDVTVSASTGEVVGEHTVQLAD